MGNLDGGLEQGEVLRAGPTGASQTDGGSSTHSLH